MRFRELAVLAIASVVATPSASIAASGQHETAAPAGSAEKYQRYLERCHAAHVCNGVYLVARHGKPVFIGAFGDSGDQARTPLTTDSEFDIGSISKQFTAMAILKLESEGKLSTGDRVSKYLPGFPYHQVTVAELLSHTSGIPSVMDEYPERLQSGAGRSLVAGRHVVEMLAARNAPLEFAPGSRYDYSNTGYLVLATLVEALTRQPLSDYLHHTFFVPLGMRHTRLRMPYNENRIALRAWGFQPAPDGSRKAYDQVAGFYMEGAGGIYTTAQDLLRWQNALIAGRVVPRRLWKQATTPTRLTDGGLSPYGFGFSLKSDGRGKQRISHGGHWRAFKSDLSYFPDMDLTVIQLTNNAENESVDANTTALETLADGGNPGPLQPEISRALYARLGESPTQVRAWFDHVLNSRPRTYVVREEAMNGLGYLLLKKNESGKATLVFQLATKVFPDSANLHDSLADAYMAQGETAAALKSEQTAVALDPTSATLRKRRDALARQLHTKVQTKADAPD